MRNAPDLDLGDIAVPMHLQPSVAGVTEAVSKSYRYLGRLPEVIYCAPEDLHTFQMFRSWIVAVNDFDFHAVRFSMQTIEIHPQENFLDGTWAVGVRDKEALIFMAWVLTNA